jgi:hypothetical protein
VELQLEHGLGLAAAAPPPRFEHVGGGCSPLKRNQLKPAEIDEIFPPLGAGWLASRSRLDQERRQCNAVRLNPVTPSLALVCGGAGGG